MITERLDTYLAAKILKCKKSLNPLTGKIGLGIYFYKNITLNLNRLNKEILEIADDIVTHAHTYHSIFPSYISVSDGIKATMFSKLPNHVIQQIITLVSGLPGYKALQLTLNSYGYKCELQRNHGKIFLGSLQINFNKVRSSNSLPQP